MGNLVGPRALLPRGTAFDLNDSGNAERLRLVYGNDLLWCGDFKEWLVFRNGVWARDNDLANMMASRVIAMTKYQAECVGNARVAKFSADSGDVRRIRGMLFLSQSALGIAVDELDQRPDLLAFQNATVDLRTGQMRDGLREDLITKQVPFDYDPEATCPRFSQFLEEIMGGGPDVGSEEAQERAARMVDALQVFLGYSITGTTSAKTVFLHIGEKGNNGKTTLLELMRTVLGDGHSTTLNIETLMQQDRETSAATASLANLRGARFANTSEVQEGKRLSGAKLKRITQGTGKVEACRKYENPISFPETHKLHIDSNDWPVIDAADEALWNRLCCIPYLCKFEGDTDDKDLGQKLKSEAKGILAWLVRGARRFYADGQRLPRPPEVTRAVQEYRAEMDKLAAFFEEYCEFGAALSVSIAAIYAAYHAWAVANGERILSSRGLVRHLLKRGVTKGRISEARLLNGVALTTPPDQLGLQ